MTERLLRLDLRSNRSRRFKHERLKAHLVDEMVSGRLQAGEALPSESQLAEALGITKVTIRRVMASLENDGLIRRVQGKGNFVKEDARRKLKRGLDIFALIVPDTRTMFYPSLLHGFENAAGDIRHQTVVCGTDNDLARQGDIILQLLRQGVGGVAIVPVSQPTTPAYQVLELQDRGIPVVFCHRRPEGLATPLLSIPFQDVGRMVGKMFVDRGHRRLAYFVAHQAPSTLAYEEALRAAMQAAGGELYTEWMCLGTSAFVLSEEQLLAGLRRVFARPNPPTGIFTPSDSWAEMMYLLLPRLGLRVPDDVSLLGFGGAWRDGALMQRLSAVVVDEVATGRLAVSLLSEMRSGKRAINDSTEIVLDLALNEGETMAAAPCAPDNN
jgi:GntR family transcriptional regulator, arabinose operon transcriptional repressor